MRKAPGNCLPYLGRAQGMVNRASGRAEARARARIYARDLPDVNGFSLGRGWYAITLGPYREDEAERVLDVYLREGVIARDSYIADSSDYGRRFWPAGDATAPAPEPEASVPSDPGPGPDETLREARDSEAGLTSDERANLQ